jgi:hypothetical protein
MLLVLAIWISVRSYFYSDTIARVTGYSQATAESIKGVVRGEVYAGNERINTYTDSVYQFRTHPTGRGPIRYDSGLMGFHWKHDNWKGRHLIEYRFPLWPLLVAVALATFLVRPKPKLRFGLFDLSLLVTMLAIAVGTSVSLMNASGLFGF